MRVPENLSTNRAAVSTIQNLEDFYDLKTTADKHDLADKAEHYRNFDEAEFSCITKPSKTGTPKGTKRVYQLASAENVETVAVLPSVHAAGQREQRAIIFKE
jgi:hypothetical protein